MVKNIYKLVNDANKALKDVAAYLAELENNGIFEKYNYKLYDVFYDVCEDSDIFYEFCDYYYNLFVEDFFETEARKTERDLLHYIGRTSSFVIYDNDNCILDNGRLCINDTMANLFDYFNNCISWIDIKNNKIDFQCIKDEIENCDNYFVTKSGVLVRIKDNLRYIISGQFLEDVKEHFNDAIIFLQLFKEYKENAAEAYKDFIVFNVA